MRRVQTLVAAFTELQREWPASLTEGFSSKALQEVAFVDYVCGWISVFEVEIADLFIRHLEGHFLVLFSL